MQKKSVLALLLALVLLLTSGCALIYKDEAVDAATEIIRVGDTVFTKAEVQSQVNYQLNYMAYMYASYGLNYTVTDEIIASTTETVVNTMVEQAVLLEKVKELGLDKLTDEEKAEVQADADALWEENRESVRTSYFAASTLTGDALEAAIDEMTISLGVTKELALQSATESYTLEKLYNEAVKDVTVTADEVTAAYADYVDTDKASYDTTPSLYCTTANNGSPVYYRPAGVRMVKQILIGLNEEDQAIIDDLTTKMTTAESTASNNYVNLSALGIADVQALVDQVAVTLDEAGVATEIVANFTEEQTEQVTELAKVVAVADAQVAYYNKAIEDAQNAAWAKIAPEADEVLKQLADGADWDALMAEKTDDPGMQAGAATAETGYAVCEGYTDFDSLFVNAAMAIPEVGGVSDKIASSFGYYIIKYVGDAVEGAVELDEELEHELEHELQHTKEESVYNGKVAEWVAAAKVKLNTKALED